ncbi:MAG TPA: cation:proton antiporter [Williamwhitmania sp.]|nr:cation:proton antiporter [Williamwhitmania sp.]
MEILQEVALVFGIASLSVFIFHKLKLPAIIGFLVAGILAGPYGFGLAGHGTRMEFLAELGVIFLLFTIGIEFSLKKLIEIRKVALLGGSVQVLLTILFTGIIVYFIGFSFQNALFIGFLVALSSTAIVLKVMQEKGVISTDYGNAALGILIFQDLAVILMMVAIPLLAGKGSEDDGAFVKLLVGAIGIIALTIVAGKYIIPRVLYQVAKTGSNELFLLVIIAIAFSITYITYALGLSLALGAFLAGLAISETDYNHHTFGQIIPFRDVFASFFFISIGMLFDLHFFMNNLLLILAVTLAVILLKAVIAGFAAFVLGFPFKSTLIVALGLAQIGEFSFILSQRGVQLGIMDDWLYRIFIASSVLTMAVAPLLMLSSIPLANKLLKLPIPKALKRGLNPVWPPKHEKLSNHLIIVGYGLNGRNMVRASKIARIPYAIVDFNPEIVRKEQRRNEPIFYGDAASDPVLLAAGIRRASVVVVAVPDAASTFGIAAAARSLNSAAYIIIRTRSTRDMEALYKLGVDEVISQDFETSVEIFSRVMARYLVPRDEIEQMVADIRSDGYRMFRSLSFQPSNAGLKDLMTQVELATFRVLPRCYVAGKSLEDIHLRRKFGLSVLLLRRNDELISNPSGELVLLEGDVVTLMGDQKQVACAVSLFTVNEPICPD